MPPVPLAVEAVAAFRQRLVDLFGERILDVRLFGSAARGPLRDESDIDVLVLVDRRTSGLERAIAGAAWDTGYERDLRQPLVPLVMTREHFDELRRRERLLAQEIERDGVPL